MRNCERSHLQACLLLLLAERSGYGYELAGRLAPLGLADVDAASTYRALRTLEADGCVTSQWTPSHSGPARRTYHLSRYGRSLLASCGERLREEHSRLGYFLTCLDSLAGAEHPPEAPGRSRAAGGRR